MEVKEKGTLKGHLKKMLSQLYLWTSQISPERFYETLKNDLCFSYDSLIFNKLQTSNENEQYYQLVFDFGDLQIDYVFVFTHSEQTKKWVLSAINV